jgi:hypothetical protein
VTRAKKREEAAHKYLEELNEAAHACETSQNGSPVIANSHVPRDGALIKSSAMLRVKFQRCCESHQLCASTLGHLTRCLHCMIEGDMLAGVGPS